MPEDQERFREAVDAMMDAVLFENWLRFYFLHQDGDEDPAKVIVPERAMERIREGYGPLASMAEELNGREASLQSSRDAVCGYISRELEGSRIPRGEAASYLDTRAFQVSMQLFGVWVQAYEAMLDAQFLDFGQWREQFVRWRGSEQGKELERRMDGELKAQAPAAKKA